MEYLVADLATRQGKHIHSQGNNGHTFNGDKFTSPCKGSSSPDSPRKRQQLSLRPVRKVLAKDYEPITSSSDEEDCSTCSKKSLHSRPTPPPRGKNGPTYANLPKTPQVTRKLQSPSNVTATCSSSSSSSSRTHPHPASSSNRSGSLDRKLADMQRFNFSEYRLHKKQMFAAAADRIRDQRTANTAQAPAPSSSAFQQSPSDAKNTSPVKSHPPTPPMHRCPSWESRIYQVACSSISSVTTSGHSIGNNCKVNTSHSGASYAMMPTSSSSSTLDQSSIFCPNVPMYSTVGGKASLIKSVPLSADSSDSSDDDDIAIKTANRTSVRTTDDASSLSNSSAGGKICRSGSENYDVPPDAVIVAGTPFRCPQTPLRYASLRKELRNLIKCNNSLEKSGYLKKLGGKFRTWHKRWFVLKDATLSYYKSESDCIRGKLRDSIRIDAKTAIARGANNANVFQVSHPSDGGKKSFLLNSNDSSVVESWISALKDISSKAQRKSTFGGEMVPSIEGWLTKVKLGHPKKTWCSLMGDNLFFFKGPDETVPFGSLNIKQTTVTEVNLSDSDSDDASTSNAKTSKFSISIQKHPEPPVYFLCDTREQFESWMYYFSLSNSDPSSVKGTEFERTVTQILNYSEDPKNERLNQLWNNEIMCAVDEPIDFALTSLPSDELKREAIQLFKSIHLFTTVPIDSSGIDYHVALAQNSLEMCLKKTSLQNEFVCQLVKQTCLPSKSPPSIPPHQPKTPSKSSFLCGQPFTSCEPFVSPCEEIQHPSSSFAHCPSVNLVQGLQLLALSLPLFLPKSQVLWLLKHHLKRIADPSNEPGQLALYCQGAIERASKAGNRLYRPSRMEVLGVLLRNPYQHSHSHSIPVHLANETYVVVGFHASTSVSEFCESVFKSIGLRSSTESGFALYSDDPINDDVDHLLKLDMKLADVISRWEMDFRDGRYGKVETTKAIKLIVKKRLFLSKSMKDASDKEKMLLVYQINQEIVNGKFPLTKELAVELSALLAHIEFGPLWSQDDLVRQSMKKFIPSCIASTVAVNLLLEQVRDRWKSLATCSQMDCIRVYLNAVRKWHYWDSHLYPAILMKCVNDDTATSSLAAGSNVCLALNEKAFSLLESEKLSLITSFALRQLVTFGGDNESFVVVVKKLTTAIYADPESSSTGATSSTASDCHMSHEKYVFSLDKWSSLELSQLMADYINIANNNSFSSSINCPPHCPSPRRVGKMVARSNTRI